MRGAGEGGGTVGGGGELQASQGQSLSQGQNAQTVWGGVARMGKLPPGMASVIQLPRQRTLPGSRPGALGGKGALDQESGAGVSVLYSLAV